MKTLDAAWLNEHNACVDGRSFAEQCGYDLDKIWATCQRGDWMIWLLRKMGRMDKPTAVRIAIACAEHVLDRFERKHPKDNRPRKAIEAAKAWLADPTEQNRHAAAAAAAAADAAAAAYAAAAYAAYAAADAAYAAAAYAAADAAAAADTAYVGECKWQADKLRELIPTITD